MIRSLKIASLALFAFVAFGANANGAKAACKIAPEALKLWESPYDEEFTQEYRRYAMQDMVAESSLVLVRDAFENLRCVIVKDLHSGGKFPASTNTEDLALTYYATRFTDYENRERQVVINDRAHITVKVTLWTGEKFTVHIFPLKDQKGLYLTTR